MDTLLFRDTQFVDENGPMTPAHAGGAMGELDAAFALGKRGFGIAIGPGGPGGHRLTASGFDIVAYNPALDRVWIVDNKASGGTSTVQGATALTTNFETNLVGAIRQIRAARSFPHQQTVVRHLEQALAAVRAGRALPPTVERYVTNAGGYHGGVSQRLRAQGIKFLDVTGAATRNTRRQDVRTARQQGVPPGRPTTHPPRPSGPAVPVPPPSPSRGGTAAVAGMRVALAGLNFGLNWLSDREQQRLVQEALARIEPAIQAERQRQPDHGILVLIYYHQVQAPPDSIIQPGATYSHLTWISGRTPDEALRALHQSASISPAPPRGSRQQVTRLWIQPQRPAAILSLQTPFPQVGYGMFSPNRGAFQGVRWGGVRGFDDTGQSWLGTALQAQIAARASLEARGQPVPPWPVPRFILLQAPRSMRWIWGRQVRTTSVPVVRRGSALAGQTLEAVDLDPISPFGNVAAVPVFPYDAFTDTVFSSAKATRDNLNQLQMYPNIRKMRWIRPENIIPVPRF
jgi:hypothetical protein